VLGGIGVLFGGQLGLVRLPAIPVTSGLLLAVWVIVLSLGSVLATYELGCNPTTRRSGS